jgi:hypothetical protein
MQVDVELTRRKCGIVTALAMTRTYLTIDVSICAGPTVIGKLKMSTEQVTDLQGILRITL